MCVQVEKGKQEENKRKASKERTRRINQDEGGVPGQCSPLVFMFLVQN